MALAEWYARSIDPGQTLSEESKQDSKVETITSYGGSTSAPSPNHRIVPASRTAASIASGSVMFLRIHAAHRASLVFVRTAARSLGTHGGSPSPTTGIPVCISSNTICNEGWEKPCHVHSFNTLFTRERVDCEERAIASRRCLVVLHNSCRIVDAGVWNGHSYEDVLATTIPR